MQNGKTRNMKTFPYFVYITGRQGDAYDRIDYSMLSTTITKTEHKLYMLIEEFYDNQSIISNLYILFHF